MIDGDRMPKIDDADDDCKYFASGDDKRHNMLPKPIDQPIDKDLANRSSYTGGHDMKKGQWISVHET